MASLTLPPKKVTDSQRDGLYNYDPAAAKTTDAAKPWRKDPNYFKTVRISAVALIKMVMHARSGGTLEVMGLMQGYVDGTALVITDAFRLPVEGTETRVNAQEDANEYMVQFLDLCRAEGRLENAVGWYHSHPGYGCWLSGIDVDTQAMQQTYNDPFVAVVVDPDRTVSANKVEIGAFRTYPDGYKAPSASSSAPPAAGGGAADVPTNKAEDFGAHASRYYSLEVEHFKSTLDSLLLEQLWNKYWVQTLAQTPLLTNREFGSRQIQDASYKVKDAASAVSQAGRSGQGMGTGGKTVDAAMEKIVRDTKQAAAKEMAGLVSSQVKTKIFSATEEVEGRASDKAR